MDKAPLIPDPEPEAGPPSSGFWSGPVLRPPAGPPGAPPAGTFEVRLSHAALFALILVLAGVLRFVSLGADPPQLLSSSNAEVMDGPWYLAAAADHARGHEPDVPRAYRRPLFTAAARAAFAVAGGVSLPAAHGLAAACGVLLVLFGGLGAFRAFGTRVGLMAALFLATSFVLVGYGRAPVVYGPLAAGLAAVFFCHAAGLRGGAGWHVAAWALAVALALFLKESAVAILPALAAGQIVAARSRFKTAAIVTVAALAGAGALHFVRPEFFGDALDKIQDYLAAAPAGGAGGATTAGATSGAAAAAPGMPGALALLKRIMNAPAESGLALKAPLLLWLAWTGVMFCLSRRDMGEFEAVIDRRIDDALEATLSVWFATSFVLPAPLGFDPGEGSVPLRWFAPALVPGAILAARALDLLGREGGIRMALGKPSAFLWALPAAYVAFSVLGHGLYRGLTTFDVAVPAWYAHAFSFRAIAVASILVAGFAAARVDGGLEGRPLAIRRSGANGLVLLVIAAEAAWLVPSLNAPRYSLRNANAQVARLLPADALVEGSFAHALTYDANVSRRQDLSYVIAPTRRGATHLAVDAQYGPRLERSYAAMGAPLTRLHDFKIRGYPVVLYRYAWAPAPPPAPAGGGGPKPPR